MSARSEIKYDCANCGRDRVYLGWQTFAGMTPFEIAGLLRQLLAEKKWGVVEDKGKLIAICPACVQQQLDGPRSLDAYDAGADCPKCGHDQITTKYCDGKDALCSLRLPVDHLHRTCSRCGYMFVQATKDQSTKESNVEISALS